MNAQAIPESVRKILEAFGVALAAALGTALVTAAAKVYEERRKAPKGKRK